MADTKLPFLNTLKAFVEGERDLQECPPWWQENAQLIEESEARTNSLSRYTS